MTPEQLSPHESSDDGKYVLRAGVTLGTVTPTPEVLTLTPKLRLLLSVTPERNVPWKHTHS